MAATTIKGNNMGSPANAAFSNWGVSTLVIATIGQSHDSFCARTRYTSKYSGSMSGPGTWYYGSGGNFYPASDPLYAPSVGGNPGFSDGAGGSWYAQLADMLIDGGYTFGGHPKSRIIFVPCTAAGTSIYEFAPGGDENAFMVGRLTDAYNHILDANGNRMAPHLILLNIGQTDVNLGRTTSQWQYGPDGSTGGCHGMLVSIRQIGNGAISAPLVVAQDTYDGLRGQMPNTTGSRTSQDLITLEYNRDQVKTAQATFPNGGGILAGPDIDNALPWQVRAQADGVHFSDYAQTLTAQAWCDKLFSLGL